ncbi:CLUMA_CG010653, isoform A [Clunio marinus]|uniref:CLUMA_CG010653, isoform A n=1 Tax=Clunio marinus TaxID=568069 RepID=A0A1J1IFM5_9DIPT|nr:CLUMA_CG010653, isoform A [Clunio marinus]
MKLDCTFETFVPCFFSEKRYYMCSIRSSSITKPNTIIQTINGDHDDGSSDKDVEAINFEGTTVKYFPQGLNKIFPNLKAVEILNCGLKSITQRDLMGLENIQMLCCDDNKITSLPNNLFQNMNKLIKISFNSNDLQFMSSEVLRPILKNGLKSVDFSGNRSIDAAYWESDNLAQFMDMIDEKCQQPINENCNGIGNIASDGFKELWTTGRFSDITIVTDTEKFKAHKVVLAMQSSVFASIFEDKMKDRPSDVIQVKSINSDVVKIFLKFLYTGEIETGNSNLLQLFTLAAKFKVENLMTIVEEMITDDLNDDNAIDVFEFACRFNCDSMKMSAFKAIQSMFDEPLKDELMNEPEAVRELVEAKRKFNSILNKHKKLKLSP